MRTVSLSLVALCCISAASAYFWVGERRSDSEVLVQKTDSWKFESSECRVIHYNTCRENDVIIDKAEVKTTSGEDAICEVLYGGQEDFFIGVKVCGDGQTTYETTIWGHFRKPKLSTQLASAYYDFSQWWPCNHSIALY